MGQRHQIYIRVPAKYYNKDNVNNRPEETFGVHRQWLYGKTAIKLLGNFLEFNSKLDEDFWKNRFDNVSNVLGAVYSLDISEGYYHRVHTDLEAECEDPRLGDNNDGITVIDLTGEKLAYCFVSLHGLECAEESRFKINNLKPLSAREYLDAYYPKFDFPKYRKDRYEIPESESAELKVECERLLSRIDAEVITPKRLKSIFPKMFVKE